MMELIESELKFIFDDSWTNIIKFDESKFFNEIKQISGTKAVDFIGIRNKSLYFIEVKNERNDKQITINNLCDKLSEIEQKITNCKTMVESNVQVDLTKKINKIEKELKNYLCLSRSRHTEYKLNEIAQKIRDSLALIIGINCTNEISEEFLAYKQILCCNEPNIKVILWNENDWVRPGKRNNLNKQLKNKLSWFTNLVFINSTAQPNPENSGFTVKLK